MEGQKEEEEAAPTQNVDIYLYICMKSIDRFIHQSVNRKQLTKGLSRGSESVG